MDGKETLLLEGGALRGVFTAGVLDVWSERGLYFPRVVSVSAGGLQALSYLARQPGRNIKINTKYCRDPRYMGMRHLLKKEGYFNFAFIFGELSESLVPFDYDAFDKAEEIMYAAATECRTGKAVYFKSSDYRARDFMRCCQASCSMPIFCRTVDIDGAAYVDGGPSVPVAPLPEELPFAAEKPVYVLTRDASYRKKHVPYLFRMLARRMYRDYPALVEAVNTLPARYNERAERIAAMERAGKAFVIRPDRPVTVHRNETNPAKLQALYDEGRKAAEESWTSLQEWLS